MTSALDEVIKDVRLFAEMAIHSLCRLEQNRQLPPLLTGDSEAWDAFSGELTLSDSIELRIRDMAPIHPWMFEVPRVVGADWSNCRYITDDWAKRILARATDRASLESGEFLRWAADRLLPRGPKWGPQLPSMESTDVALELPGSGGLFAYRISLKSPGVSIHQNFVILCGTQSEVLFAGLAAMESGVPSGAKMKIVRGDIEEETVQDRRYDFVIGSSAHQDLSHSPVQALLRPGGQVLMSE